MRSVVKRIYLAFFAILAVVVSAAWTSIWNYFAPDSNIYNPRFFVLMIGLTVIATFSIMYLLLELEKSKSETLALKLHNAEAEVHNSQKLAYMDTLTGIPNQLMFEKDFEKLKMTVSEQNPVHIIMIDLDDFGSINKKFGHENGNKVLQFVAQIIYKSMRRDEEMYLKKIIPDYSLLGELKSKLFRMHQAGDEFLFAINDEMSASLGFVTRLKTKLNLEGHEIARILDIKPTKKAY